MVQTLLSSSICSWPAGSNGKARIGLPGRKNAGKVGSGAWLAVNCQVRPLAHATNPAAFNSTWTGSPHAPSISTNNKKGDTSAEESSAILTRQKTDGSRFPGFWLYSNETVKSSQARSIWL